MKDYYFIVQVRRIGGRSEQKIVRTIEAETRDQAQTKLFKRIIYDKQVIEKFKEITKEERQRLQELIDKQELTPIKNNRCGFCGQKADPEEMDNESLKEWEISKLCQECQDKTFK